MLPAVEGCCITSTSNSSQAHQASVSVCIQELSMAGRGNTDEAVRGPGYVGLRQNIANLIETPPFSVGGTLDISDCAKIVLQLSDEDNIMSVDFNLRHVVVTEAQRMCVPSAYNDLVRNEWRVDPSVRLAMECPAERMKVIASDPAHSFESNFQDVLKDDLFMGTYEQIEIVPNKLNIYSEGGHFTAHKDSSRVDPARYLGTLVVALHSAYTGGELYVRNEGQETLYDFSIHSADPNIIQFAAFIGDCEHEVKPVTSGHRVVLTYTLLRPFKILPSGAKLLSKTVSAPYISHDELTSSIVDTETVSQRVAPAVTLQSLFGDDSDNPDFVDYEFQGSNHYDDSEYDRYERHSCNAD